MKNALFVIPRYVSGRYDFYQFPLGLAYVASVAIKDGRLNTFGLNLNHTDGSGDKLLKDTILNKEIDYLFTGGLSSHFHEVKQILDVARFTKPNITQIVGNGIVSGDPVASMEALDIDIGVIGEGEETIIELTDAFLNLRSINDVEGIIYRNGNKIHRTRERKSNSALDTIPMPNFDLFNYQLDIDRQTKLDNYFFETCKHPKPRSIDMITSRSCPFMCTFCFHPVGKVYRERNISCVGEEILHYKERYNINMVAILDELFSLKHSRLLEFCKMIKDYDLQWMVQLHVRTAKRDLLKAMKDSGCTYISFGIESMSPRILRSMAKKSTVEEIQRAIDLTHEVGIGIQGNLIFGDTEEDFTTANESMNWWYKNRKSSIYLSRLQVYPGSPDYILAVRDGIIKPEARLSFLKTLPEEVNLTYLNDVNYTFMNRALKIYGRTILRSVYPTSFLVNRHASETRRETPYVTFSFRCFHCNKNNEYVNVNLRQEHHLYIRLTCRFCFLRSDMVNSLYVAYTGTAIKQTDSEEVPVKVSLLGGGSNFTASRRSIYLTLDQHFYSKVDLTKLALRNLLLLEAELSTTEAADQKLLSSALDATGDLLISRPFCPTAHIRYGRELLNLGITGGALLHIEQAETLRKMYFESSTQYNIELPESIKRGWVSELAEAKRKISINGSEMNFFVSMSDEPARFRESRRTGGYKSHQEPNFPDFSHVDVTRSSMKRLIKIEPHNAN